MSVPKSSFLERANVSYGGKVVRSITLEQQAMKGDVVADCDYAGKAMACERVKNSRTRIGRRFLL